ncbi:MAG: GNAT family N-acetyltransferase [Candidatus Thorarchaeota archaeon]
MESLIIKTEKWAEVNQEKLIDFTIDVWKKKGSTLTNEQLQRWFQRMDFDIPPLCIQAFINGELVGWILLAYHSEEEAEINPWLLNGHPICKQNLSEKYEISKTLIESAKNLITPTKVTRLEINFKNNIAYDQDFGDLYSTLGFYLLEENCHMRLNLLQNRNPEKIFSSMYSIIPLTSIDEKELFNCFQFIFRNSEDKWLLDKSDKELKQYFDDTIINSRFQLISDVSIAILDQDKIIAFSVIRESHGEANGHIWIMGVHPEYRKQGLGKYLINYSKQLLPVKGYKTLSLNVDLSNIPAVRLYESQGFNKNWIQTNYTWRK